MQVNKFVTSAVLDKLFFNVTGKGKSNDLIARNVQRARDHGLPPYLAFVRKYAWLYWSWQAEPAFLSAGCIKTYKQHPLDR